MYKLCKTEQSANRQRGLEQGLLQAMQIKHFDEISVSDLCAQLDVPRKAFYRYFDSKEGALHALLDHTLMAYESFPLIYSEGEKRTLVRELEQFFLFWIRQKSLLDALQRSSLSGVLIERAIAAASIKAYAHVGMLGAVFANKRGCISRALRLVYLTVKLILDAFHNCFNDAVIVFFSCRRVYNKIVLHKNVLP